MNYRLRLVKCTDDPQIPCNPHFRTSKIPPLIRPSYAESGLSYTANKHFELSHSGAVKLSSKLYFEPIKRQKGRSQWPRRQRRVSATACLLGLRVRIPPGAFMSVCCECYVLSCRGLSDGLITRPEESVCL